MCPSFRRVFVLDENHVQLAVWTGNNFVLGDTLRLNTGDIAPNTQVLVYPVDDTTWEVIACEAPQWP